ncbi:hypothetical protein J1M35_00135 [Ottowia testudinis]|uniref:Uncharacterized protein n=1 Tax=Ottowia testudinis TaxID=2816950 RepID=A0A975CGJ4_9BURK|nr:hypothetical protein J1M35_00135 [Ottowia testudinis]
MMTALVRGPLALGAVLLLGWGLAAELALVTPPAFLFGVRAARSNTADLIAARAFQASAKT